MIIVDKLASQESCSERPIQMNLVSGSEIILSLMFMALGYLA